MPMLAMILGVSFVVVASAVAIDWLVTRFDPTRGSLR